MLGLSGGIDSALTLAIAVDALGKERVHAVMMPFAYTAQMSMEDAEAEARTLGVAYRVLPIESAYNGFMDILRDEFAGLPADLAEQNLQARCRGVLLMALSNKQGHLVLTTGNKSEMAVGYSTLYGDMAGGFDVLKDVPKMQVYALSRYRNARDGMEVIPQRVIDRPPSAELAPGQVDADNLPPYPVLDRILELYIEEDRSAADIVAEGFDRAVVEKVLRLVDINEHKRRQAPVGVRISKRGFGRATPSRRAGVWGIEPWACLSHAAAAAIAKAVRTPSQNAWPKHQVRTIRSTSSEGACPETRTIHTGAPTCAS